MSHRLLISAFWLLPYACGLLAAGAHPNESSIPPTVVQVDLREMVEPVSAEFVVRGIRHANQINAMLATGSVMASCFTSNPAIVTATLSPRNR